MYRFYRQIFKILIIVFLVFPLSLSAQRVARNKSAREEMSKDPVVATLLSAAIPGAGQIYNHKYLYAPAIYVGFATFGYFINYNNKIYNKYRKIYNQKVNGDPNLDPLYDNVNAESIKRERDKWRKWRDMNVIGFGALYFLQILEANVDAYLFDYDISDDLTLNWSPLFCPPEYNSSLNNKSTIGVQLTLKF